MSTAILCCKGPVEQKTAASFKLALFNSSMAPQEADLTSKYEIRHQIGKGSFGSAFLVTSKQDRKDYVLKRVRLAKQTKWQRNSTLQERDLVMTLQHPFIVPCVESWLVQDHTVNMIYGYCEKGDLCTYLAKAQRTRSQVDEQIMMKWLCQLLLALDYLQTMKVLHRDIKTSNVLLTSDMDAQLGDFGLATLMQEAGGGSKPEDTNLVGTPHYMSPELLSCKDYGFKTDVWSLGCVFYELTAQRPTFNAFNIHGLVSKIKRNKLAPLPDGYSNEWKEVVMLMLCKNPDRRPSVQELMGLPQLRPALLEARERAQVLMPSIQLPPLLDPTPLYLRVSRAADNEGSEPGATACSGDMSSSPDRECLDAVPAGVDEGCDTSSNWAAGTLAAQAIQEAELSEIWRVSSMTQQEQQQHHQQQQQQDQQQHDMQNEEADSDCHLTDNHGSRCSMSSRASSLCGSLKAHSHVTGISGLATIKQVRQPGISKTTAAERVAAAIAAARAGTIQATTQQGQQAVTAVEQPTEAEATAAESSAISTNTSSSNHSTAAPVQCKAAASSSVKAIGPPTVALANAGRPPSAQARPHSAGRPSTAATPPRPAWNAGSAAGALHRQRSATAKTPTFKAASGQPASEQDCSARKTAGTQGRYLQQLEQQQRQQRKQSKAEVAAADQQAADSIQQLLDRSQELSRMTVQLQEGMQQQPPQQQQQQAKLCGQQRPVSGSRTPQGASHSIPQQQEGLLRFADVDSDSDDESSSSAESMIKQLRFESVSPRGSGTTSAACSSRRRSDLSAATSPAAVVNQAAEAATPDMFAAARGINCSEYNSAQLVEDSPVLWPSSATPAKQEQANCGTSAPDHSCSRSSWAATNSNSSLGSGGSCAPAQTFTDVMLMAAGDAAEQSRSQQSHTMNKQQRLQLLGNVVQLMGSLYARGRWQEMGNVLRSPGLLPAATQLAVQAAITQEPVINQRNSRGMRNNSSSSRPGSSPNSGDGSNSSRNKKHQAAGEGLARSALKLGDMVVLGRSKKVKGKVRYIGPVAWDTKGEEWVGMELDTPCGMNGTQQGITYFACPPKCAAFHRVSQLASA